MKKTSVNLPMLLLSLGSAALRKNKRRTATVQVPKQQKLSLILPILVPTAVLLVGGVVVWNNAARAEAIARRSKPKTIFVMLSVLVVLMVVGGVIVWNNAARAYPESLSAMPPVAAIELCDSVLIIDAAGRVWGKTDSLPSGLIVIRGIAPVDAVEGSQIKTAPDGEAQLLNMKDVLAAFEREHMVGYVSYLDVTHVSRIYFEYMGRFQVILGDSRNLQGKLELLAASVDAIDEIVGEYAMGIIDIAELHIGARFTPLTVLSSG